MTKDEALRLALEALESHLVWFSRDTMIGKSMRDKTDQAITAIKAALKAKDEPLAWMCADESLINKGYARFSHVCMGEWKIPVYTTPPQRKPLTDEELRNHYQSNEWLDGVRFAEQFHGIKGEA